MLLVATILLLVPLRDCKFVEDLTWSFGNDTTYWPGNQPFHFVEQNIVSGDGYAYAVNEFCAAEHGGTHFDAPYHFYQQSEKVSEIDPSRLYAKGALINLTTEAETLGRNARLTVKHLLDWQKRNGQFQPGTVLLVQFGRSKYWQNRTKYLELEGETLNFPGFSNEAADWIVDNKNFYGVGLDTPSIDPGNTTDYYVHTLFAKRSLYNIENVKLLSPQIPETGFDLVVAPMKIEGGTGAPARVFALLNH